MPEPPSDWEETQKRVQAIAAGVDPDTREEVQATRGVVATMSGGATFSERAPQGVDGLVVTCGGEGTGRLVTGKGDPVSFSCGVIVDTALPADERTITIEVEDDTYWTLAYYEGATPSE